MRVDLVVAEECEGGELVVTKGGADVDGGPLRMGAVRVDLVVDEEGVGDLIVTK